MRRASILVLVGFALLSVTSIASAQSKTREQLIEEIGSKRSELSALEQQFLAVTEADEKAFAELLSQPNTGLIRLLPRDVFESAVYKKNKKTLTITGGGAYYSFVRLTHEYGYGSDISLDSGHLSVGFAGADYGMIVKLGDSALENLSATHPLVVPLTRYIPAKTEPEARIEQRRFSSETEIEGLSLRNRVPAEVNATYLIRSIDYGDSDVLVAIKVVRRDSDGSLIVAWKLLEKYSTPNLARETNILR